MMAATLNVLMTMTSFHASVMADEFGCVGPGDEPDKVCDADDTKAGQRACLIFLSSVKSPHAESRQSCALPMSLTKVSLQIHFKSSPEHPVSPRREVRQEN